MIEPRVGRARFAAHGSLVIALAWSVAVVALLIRIGADARWLAALGHTIVARGGIPSGVPFASAPSSHWANPLALAELVFHGLEGGLGDRGLMLAQVLAVGIAFSALARDALDAGASSEGAASALILAIIGTAGSLVIARVQLFSIALFPVLVWLLRADARRPSRRLWVVPGLLALWANLHGVALLGLLVVLAYLTMRRSRESPATAIAVGAASIAALFLTPALLDTPSYYHGVFTNLAAQRGVGLWAHVSLSAPLDDLTLLALVILGFRAARARLEPWEGAVIAGLALAGASASRSLVWLVLFLVAPAARSARRERREWGRLLPISCVAATALMGVAIARGPVATGAKDSLVRRAIALAHGTPILATDLLAERFALDGARIWLGNPLDAFSKHDQAAYLDWVEGRPRGLVALGSQVSIVLVPSGSDAARLMTRANGFAALASDGAATIYQRTGPTPPTASPRTGGPVRGARGALSRARSEVRGSRGAAG